jgi:prepilin-type N-terminal cleavage/methylation domain-containing protein
MGSDFCNQNVLVCVLSDMKDRTMRVRRKNAFTLVEMLVVIGIIGILMSMLAPALSRAKQKGNRIACLNDIRQLGLAGGMYAGDHDGEYPRRDSFTNSWIWTLRPYYQNPKILRCPADTWTADHSYLINGWNDFWQDHLSQDEYKMVMRYRYPHGMKESDIKIPTDTVLFGEKKVGSPHVHMDLNQGNNGNDKDEVNHNMHKSGNGKTSGGSNFHFVDGSARMLPYGGSVKPVNMWAVTDQWRNAPVDLPQ